MTDDDSFNASTALRQAPIVDSNRNRIVVFYFHIHGADLILVIGDCRFRHHRVAVLGSDSEHTCIFSVISPPCNGQPRYGGGTDFGEGERNASRGGNIADVSRISVIVVRENIERAVQ